MNSDPQIRTRTQTRPRSRRISACYRHPAEPVTGFCALCLRDRLAGLDSSDSPEPADFASSLSKSGAGSNTDASSSMRELRRSKSVVAGRCEVVSGVSDQRRRSCDVRASSTLSDLFNRDDVSKGVDGEVKVESKNLGFDNGERIRVADEVMAPDLDGDDVIGEDLKTMKEHIDLECRSSRKSNARDLREIAGNLLGAASVFSNKLKKWRQKEKLKKQSGYSGGGADRQAGRDSQSEVADYGFGRRSCDTEPRFSIDANRMSVDDSRFSFDEPRASWDGYLIARTIPRLTPMLSVVDNVMSGSMNRVDNLQMQVINEDVGNSGESAQSNSDSSSSNRQSSSDRSSSIRSSTKGLGLEGDEMSRISNAKVSPTNDVIFHGTKLVITERELKDWHLNSLKHGNLEGAESISIGAASSMATGSASNGFKKARASRWRKVCNLWGYKHRLNDKKGGDFVGNAGGEKLGSEIDGLDIGHSDAKLIRCSSVVNLRNTPITVGSNESATARGCSKKGREEFLLERNKSGRHSMSDLDSGLLRFHLTPFRNYSRSKSGKSRVKNSPAMARNGLLLN